MHAVFRFELQASVMLLVSLGKSTVRYALGSMHYQYHKLEGSVVIHVFIKEFNTMRDGQNTAMRKSYVRFQLEILIIII